MSNNNAPQLIPINPTKLMQSAPTHSLVTSQLKSPNNTAKIRIPYLMKHHKQAPYILEELPSHCLWISPREIGIMHSLGSTKFWPITISSPSQWYVRSEGATQVS